MYVICGCLWDTYLGCTILDYVFNFNFNLIVIGNFRNNDFEKKFEFLLKLLSYL